MSVSRAASLLVAFSLLSIGADAQVAAQNSRDGCIDRGDVPYVSRMTYTMRTVGRTRILIASGRFDLFAAERFQAFLPSAGNIDEIWLDSPGGIAAEGIELGLAIRKGGFPTRVPQGFSCISACTMAFLGGLFRTLDPGSNFGIHAARNDTLISVYSTDAGSGDDRVDRRLAFHKQEVDMQQLGAQMQSYSMRMGVSSRFVSDAMLEQAAITEKKNEDGKRDTGVAFRCITAQEARQYYVTNF